MKKVKLVEGESGLYEIIIDDEEIIGMITIREDEYDDIDDEDDEDYGKENFYLVERLDILKEHRNKGYGTQVLTLLKKIYGHYYIVPDSEGSQRLYDRVGSEVSSKEYWEWGHAFDRNFGVYEIS